MKKKKHLFSIFILLILFISCEKEKGFIDDRGPGLYLKRYSPGYFTNEFEYNENRFLVKEYTYRNGSDKVVAHRLFDYENGELSMIRRYESNILLSEEFFYYSGDRLTLIEYIGYDYKGLSSYIAMEIELDSKGQLQNCYYLDSNSNRINDFRIEYFWDKGNLIKIKEYVPSEIWVREFEYDTKSNPYQKNKVQKYPHTWWVWYPTFLSKNNVIKETSFTLDSRILEQKYKPTITDYEYIYEGSLPIEGKSEPWDLKYSFEYVYLK